MFSERKFVMTGASGGIGRVVADLLLQQGAALTTISRSGVGPVAAQNLKADLSTSAGIETAAAIVVRERPDVLVNLAGIQYCGRFEEQSATAIRDGYFINLVAPVTLCRAALRAMQDRGRGQIVNVGSILGSIGHAHFAAYSSAKAGLRSFSEALRRELVDTGISVTYVAPRAVRTAVITPILEQYAQLSRMTIDEPERIGVRIVAAIKRNEKDVYLGFPESFFVRLNALVPRLVDRALAAKDRKTRHLFISPELVKERPA